MILYPAMVETEQGNNPVNPFDPLVDEAYRLYIENEPQNGVFSSIYLFEEAAEEVLLKEQARGNSIKDIFNSLLKQRRSEPFSWQPHITFDDFIDAESLDELYQRFAKTLLIDESLSRHPDIHDKDLERYSIWDPQVWEQIEAKKDEE